MSKFIQFKNNYIDECENILFVGNVKYRILSEDTQSYIVNNSFKGNIKICKSEEGRSYTVGNIVSPYISKNKMD